MGTTQCRTTHRSFDQYGDVSHAVIGDPTDPGTQLTFSSERDAFGNVVQTTAFDAFGHVRTACVSYEPEGIFPYAVKNPLGHTMLTAYDTGLGVLTGAVDPNGLTTRRRYDGFGRFTEEDRPDGSWTSTGLSRAKDGGPQGTWWDLKVSTQEGGGPSSVRELDSLGRPVHAWAHVAATKSCGASTCAPALEIEQVTTYDHLGRVVRVTQPWMIGDALSGKYADAYAYDDAGRVTQHTEPWGRVTTYAYGHDVVSATDWLGTTKKQSDALGRVVTVTDKSGGTTHTEYGPFGLPWEVSRFAFETTATSRDAYGRVLVEDDPDSGTTTTTYDGFGEVLAIDDAAERHYDFTYDALGRLVEREDHVAGETSTTRWQYDTAAHGVGKIAKVTSPAGHVDTYTYTPLSQPATHTLMLGDTGETFESGQSYDALGRVSLVLYPPPVSIGELVVRREYDAFGNLVAVRDDTTQAAYWQLGQLDGAGRATAETLGNGVTVGHDYAPESGLVQHIRAQRAPSKTPGALLQNLGYSYDLALRMTARTDDLQPGVIGGRTESFAYDAIDRLTCASFDALAFGKGPAPCAAPIDYEPNGNIKSKDGLAYAYDLDHPHAVSDGGRGRVRERRRRQPDGAPGRDDRVHALRSAGALCVPGRQPHGLRLRRRPAPDPEDARLRARHAAGGDGLPRRALRARARGGRRSASVLRRGGERDAGDHAGGGRRGSGGVSADGCAGVGRHDHRRRGHADREAELRRVRGAEEPRVGGAAARGRVRAGRAADGVCGARRR